RQGFLILAAVPAAGFIWLSSQLPTVLTSQAQVASGTTDNSTLIQVWDWITQLNIQLPFRLDTLSAFLGLIVLGVGAADLVYCARSCLANDPRRGVFGARIC